MSRPSVGAPTHWFVSLPNDEGDSTRETLEKLAGNLKSGSGAAGGDDEFLASVVQFDVPSKKLQVGTLDQLMILSDAMDRNVSHALSIVRRAERMIEDGAAAEKQLARGTSSRGVASNHPSDVPKGLKLRVDGRAVGKWLRNHFRWDHQTWDCEQALFRLAAQLRATADARDEEMRSYWTGFQEKRQEFQELEKRRGGSFLSGSIEAVLTEDALREAAVDLFVESDFVKSVAVVVPSGLSDRFLGEYEGLAAGAVVVAEGALAARAAARKEAEAKAKARGRPGASAGAAGGAGGGGGGGGRSGPSGGAAGLVADADADAPRISPVVPRSARKVSEDDEGMGLFVVNVLVDYVDEFTAAAKQRRYVVRDWTYTPSAGGELSTQSARAEVEMRAALAELRGQTERIYSECFKAWVHMSAIKLFVESILEYGLPVRCGFAMIRPLGGHFAAVKSRLQEVYASVGRRAGGGGLDGEDLDSDEEEEAKGGGSKELPFVGWSVSVNETIRG